MQVSLKHVFPLEINQEKIELQSLYILLQLMPCISIGIDVYKKNRA